MNIIIIIISNTSMQLFILTARSAGRCSTFGEFGFILYFILILYFTFYIKGHHTQLNGSTEAMLNPAAAAVQKPPKNIRLLHSCYRSESCVSLWHVSRFKSRRMHKEDTNYKPPKLLQEMQEMKM